MGLKVGNNRLPGEGDGETGGPGSSYNTIPRAVFVLSAALLRMTFGASTWKELRKVTGGLYESTTLLPSTDASYYQDLLFHNRDNVIRWLDLYVDELRSFRELVASEDAEALTETFDKAVDARILWLDQRKKGYPDQEKEETELTTKSGFLGGLLGLYA